MKKKVRVVSLLIFALVVTISIGCALRADVAADQMQNIQPKAAQDMQIPAVPGIAADDINMDNLNRQGSGDWQSAFSEYIRTNKLGLVEDTDYVLINLDGTTNVPSLVIQGFSEEEYSGIYQEFYLLSFYNNKVVVNNLSRPGAFSYLENQNIMYLSQSWTGSGTDTIYFLEQGTLIKADQGWYSWTDHPMLYIWNDTEVSEQQYAELLSNAFDKSHAIGIKYAIDWYTKDEILSILDSES